MSDPPWVIVDLDLAKGPRTLAPSDRPHLVVFWWRDLPLGVRALLPAELPFSPAQVIETAAPMIADQALARGDAGPAHAGVDGASRDAPTVAAAVQSDMLARLEAMAGAPPPHAGALSVVICTRDRPTMLARCLESLAFQASPPRQVVVVDNSPGASARSACQGRPAVTYVHQATPGLSRARNAGVAAAQGEIIAFTDDDVVLSANWTREIVRAFQDNPTADAVTGLILPAEIETPAQRAFELDLGGFTSRHVPMVFDPGFLACTRAMGPQVWRIGAGANMAFRRSVFTRFGGFDERLGAGASGCSEDSEFWYRILAGGGTCLYEPRAVVRHHHRRTWADLRRQLRAYMKGHVAALVVQADRYGDRGNLRRIFRQLPAYFARTAVQAVQNLQGWRLRLLIEEMTGWALGLSYLLRPAWRRAGRPHPGRAPPAEPSAPEVRHA